MSLGPESEHRECRARWRGSDGREWVFPVLHLELHVVAVECPDPSMGLRISQLLPGFRVTAGGRQIYSGRAVVHELMATGHSLIVRVRVEEGWQLLTEASSSALCASLDQWLQGWRRELRIDPRYREVVMDLHTFLMGLGSWCGQIELESGVARGREGGVHRRRLATLLAPRVQPQLQGLFERFEGVSREMEERNRPFFEAYARRVLHPVLLCSPFVSRAYRKPLGYAGDYETVDMMFRDPCEGETLFAQIINYYALHLTPIQAHRNRVAYLTDLLEREALRCSATGLPLRYLSLGCGPAREVQAFIRRSPIAAAVDYTLVDYDPTAVQYVREVMAGISTLDGRPLGFRVLRKSLRRFLHRPTPAQPSAAPDSGYDLICCAGLFDYLPDALCRQATESMEGMLRPGGCLVLTNVDENPCRFQMEVFLDWQVAARDCHDLAALLPPGMATERVECRSELTGVNLLMEIRQPESARARGPELQTRPG